MIRSASLTDIPELMRLCRLMHAESGNRYALDEAKLQNLLERILIDPTFGIAVVAARGAKLVGLMVGLVTPHFYSKARIATDLGLYVDPEHRGGATAVGLVGAFERRAVVLGADEICPGVSVGINDELAVKLYESLGYERKSIGMWKPCARKN